ncbi:MAG: LytTR family transcriptional regulator DNA-binding domain-containing protein [Thermoanaerobaculia bacterium]
MTTATDRILLNLADGLRRAVDPAEVYYLEAEGGETLVRLRSAKRLVDLREFGEVVPLFEPHSFLRISREAAVNLRRIRDIRLRASGRDWEVKLEPPVNKVLPVSRALLSSVWKAFRAE